MVERFDDSDGNKKTVRVEDIIRKNKEEQKKVAPKDLGLEKVRKMLERQLQLNPEDKTIQGHLDELNNRIGE